MPDQPPRRSLLAGFPIALLLIATVAVSGYGIYLLTSGSPTLGIFLIGLGLVFLPVPLVAMIGAVICLGAGGYSFYLYGVNLRGVVFVVVALITLSDHAQSLAHRREVGPKDAP